MNNEHNQNTSDKLTDFLLQGYRDLWAAINKQGATLGRIEVNTACIPSLVKTQEEQCNRILQLEKTECIRCGEVSHATKTEKRVLWVMGAGGAIVGSLLSPLIHWAFTKIFTGQ